MSRGVLTPLRSRIRGVHLVADSLRNTSRRSVLDAALIICSNAHHAHRVYWQTYGHGPADLHVRPFRNASMKHYVIRILLTVIGLLFHPSGLTALDVNLDEFKKGNLGKIEWYINGKANNGVECSLMVLSNGTIDYSIGDFEGRIIPILDTSDYVARIIMITSAVPVGGKESDAITISISRHPEPDRSTDSAESKNDMIKLINEVRMLQPKMDKMVEEMLKKE